MGAILVGLAVLGSLALLVFGRGDLLAYTPLVVMAVCALTGFRQASAQPLPADDEARVDSPTPEDERGRVIEWSAHRHHDRSLADVGN